MRDILALSELLDLQVEDSHVERLLHLRQTLPELDQYRQVSEELKQATDKLDRAQSEKRSLDLDLDRSEGELSIVEAKLEQSEKRLYAGGMSAKETEFMRLEVESLRGQKDALEERVLAYLERSQELAERVAAAAAVVDELTSERDRLEAIVQSKWTDIDRQVEQHRAKRAEILPSIPADLLELYEQLRQSKEGVAIGRLTDRVCGGCHLTLSATELAEVEKSDPPRCTHCRRILVI